MKKMLITLATLMTSAAAFAEEAAGSAATGDKGMIALAAGIAISIAVLGGALGQGKAASAALDGISRNPAATDKVFTPFILSLALIESLVILAFLVSFVKIGGLL